MFVIILLCQYPHEFVKIRNGIPLSINVVLSNMVVLLFIFIGPSVAMLISILFGYIFLNGCTFTLGISFSSTSFCVATCLSTDCYSMPSSSSDFWICIGSIIVLLGFLAPLNSNLFFIFAKIYYR